MKNIYGEVRDSLIMASKKAEDGDAYEQSRELLGMAIIAHMFQNINTHYVPRLAIVCYLMDELVTNPKQELEETITTMQKLVSACNGKEELWIGEVDKNLKAVIIFFHPDMWDILREHQTSVGSLASFVIDEVELNWDQFCSLDGIDRVE